MRWRRRKILLVMTHLIVSHCEICNRVMLSKTWVKLTNALADWKCPCDLFIQNTDLQTCCQFANEEILSIQYKLNSVYELYLCHVVPHFVKKKKKKVYNTQQCMSWSFEASFLVKALLLLLLFFIIFFCETAKITFLLLL